MEASAQHVLSCSLGHKAANQSNFHEEKMIIQIFFVHFIVASQIHKSAVGLRKGFMLSQWDHERVLSSHNGITKGFYPLTMGLRKCFMLSQWDYERVLCSHNGITKGFYALTMGLQKGFMLSQWDH